MSSYFLAFGSRGEKYEVRLQDNWGRDGDRNAGRRGTQARDEGKKRNSARKIRPVRVAWTDEDEKRGLLSRLSVRCGAEVYVEAAATLGLREEVSCRIR